MSSQRARDSLSRYFRSALLLLLLLPGCGGRSGLLSAGEAPGQADQGSLRRDGAIRPADGAVADRPRADRSRPADAPPPLPDGPRPPCAGPLASLLQTFSATMAVCRAAQGQWYDQCQVAVLCGPGWRLCRASEYRQRFGAGAGPPGTERTWLGGCVMSAGVPHAPLDQACGQCPTQVVQTPLCGWHCSKDMAASVQRTHAGLVSYPECMQVGLPSAATAAHWAPCAPDYKLRQAFCCR